MKLLPCFLVVFFLVENGFAQNQPPVIQNFQALSSNPNELTITYDLLDNENDDVEITFRVSDDNGKTFLILFILFPYIFRVFPPKGGKICFQNSLFFLFSPTHIFFISPLPLSRDPMQNIHPCIQVLAAHTGRKALSEMEAPCK